MAKKTDQNTDGNIGHNSEDELLRGYVQKTAGLVREMQEINGEIKEVLREAKDAGFLKMAIRRAVKDLMMNEEQRQARKEVDAETKRITELCSDLPLFGSSDKEDA